MMQARAVLAQASEAGRVPGVVALAADGAGRVFAGAAGRRSLDGPAPMTLDTVFWIASLTKAVTSVAAMQLVEAGRVGLDDPLGPVLPELLDPQVLEGFGSDGAPRLRPARTAVTLRRLLTHTAGYGYDFWDPEIARYMEHTGTPPTRSGDPAAFRVPLLFDPGTRWHYGINTDLVGRAVAALSGLGLGAYLARHVFEPLGMADTGFGVRPDQRERLVGRHARSPDGQLAVTPFDPPERPAFESGGGGLYSTGPDYLRFLRALLGGGTLDGARILAPETAAAMGRDQLDGLDVPPLPASHVPGLSNAAEFFPGMGKRWGLGFLINTRAVTGRRAAGSLAWAGLANTYYWIDPASGMTGLVMTQILPFADPAVLDLLGDFEAAVYADLAVR